MSCRILLVTLCVFAGLGRLRAADVPQQILYQGRLKEDALHVDGTRTMVVALYAAAGGGDALWTETHTDVPVVRGLFQLALGTHAAIPDDVLARAELYVGVQVGPTVLPRTRLTATPHARVAGLAVRALDADTADHAVVADLATAVAAGAVETESLQDGAVTAAKLDPSILQRLSSLEAHLAVATWLTGELGKSLGSLDDDLGRGVCRDSHGNVYVVGHTDGALQGDTEGVGNDVFLTKWNKAGAMQWTKQLEASPASSAGYDFGYDVCCDDEDNVYITGRTDGKLGSVDSHGRADAFVVKWNAAGTRQWTRQIGTDQYDYAYGICCDGSSIYIAGHTSGVLPGEVQAGYGDLLVARLTSDGTLSWAHQYGGAAADVAIDIACDDSGNLYVGGYTKGGLAGGNAGAEDMVLIKLDTTGAEQWTRQIGSSGSDFGVSVACDNVGSVYLSGWTEGTLPGQARAGGRDAVLIKWSETGVRKWIRQFGTAGDDLGQGATCDPAGHVYQTGCLSGSFDDQPASGGKDLFLTKWEADGTRAWTRLVGSSADDCGSGLALDPLGCVLVTGYSSGALGSTPNRGGQDAILIRFSPDGLLP